MGNQKIKFKENPDQQSARLRISSLRSKSGQLHVAIFLPEEVVLYPIGSRDRFRVGPVKVVRSTLPLDYQPQKSRVFVQRSGEVERMTTGSSFMMVRDTGEHEFYKIELEDTDPN